MLNLQDLLGGALDVLRDLMPVRRTKKQGSQDEHVERALEQLDPLGWILLPCRW